MRTERRFSMKILIAALGVIIAAALVALVCVNTNAFAKNSNVTMYSYEQSFLSKNVQAPNNASFDRQFDFTFTKVSIDDDPTQAEAIPDIGFENQINHQTLEIKVDNGVIDENTKFKDVDEFTHKPEANPTAETTNAYIVQRPLKYFMPAVDKFTKAGVYLYTVTETPVTPAVDEWDMSGASYNLRIYVENVEGTSNLVIVGVTYEQTKDDNGADIEVLKKDPQKNPGASNQTTPTTTKDTPPKDTFVYNGFTFMNRYNPLRDLTISKTVSGEYGDKTKDFDYTLTLWNTDSKTGDTFTGYIGGDYARTVDFVFPEKSFNAQNTFKLKHGESIVFNGENGSTLLPVGTQYYLTETGTPDYTASATTVSKTNSGEDVSQTTNAEKGMNLDVDYNVVKNPSVVVGNGFGNSTAIINTKSNVTPTGFLIDNMPYILLIGIPVIAAIAWLVYRRKKANS